MGHHGQPLVDGGWGIVGGDFCGKGRGIGTRLVVVVGVGTIGDGGSTRVGKGGGGWTDEGNHYCISRFILKSIVCWRIWVKTPMCS